MLPSPSVDQPPPPPAKREWITRTQVAANLPMIVGAIVAWPFMSDEPLGVQVLLTLVGALLLGAGAIFVVLAALHIVAKVADKPAPPMASGLDMHVTAAAALALAIWGLGHHWVRERDELVLRCVSEVEQDGIKGRHWRSQESTLRGAVWSCVHSSSDTGPRDYDD